MAPLDDIRLKPHWFQILLAIADRDQHGLAIMKEVLDRTQGQMQLWPGMLYGSLKQMLELGLVFEAETPPGAETGGGKPRFYGITEEGKEILVQEVKRLSRFIEAARVKNLVAGADRASETRT